MLNYSLCFRTHWFLLLCLGLAGGCRQEVPSDSADHPARQTNAPTELHDTPLSEGEINLLRTQTNSWTAAVARVQTLRDTIERETTTGNPAAAHRALDELDYVLQWLPEIVQDSNIPKEHWQAIGQNTQTLRDAFDKVHANIDDGKAPDYPSVAAEIDRAIDELAAIAPEAEPSGQDADLR